jgi:hypothetical protein
MNQTHDLPPCSIVLQATMLPSAPDVHVLTAYIENIEKDKEVLKLEIESILV